MSNVLGCTVAAIALAGAAVTPAAESPPASPAPPVAAQWKAQRLDFSYTGFTTRYTCDGLEDKVRQILLEFGARKDLKVRATGCESGPRGPDYPSRFAWVNAEFYSLEPAPVAGAATGSAPPATVMARWTAMDMSAKRPRYMDDGDCELVDPLRDVLRKGFALQDVDFRATCTPHQLSMGSYHLAAKVLKLDLAKAQPAAAASP